MGRFLWNLSARCRLEGLVNGTTKEQKRLRRFPVEKWAGMFGCSQMAIRNELERGRCRMGSPEKGYFVYDANLGEEKARQGKKRQGNKGVLVWKKNDKQFAQALNFLCDLLLRKKTHKRHAGFYSVEACWRLTKKKYPEWSVCLQTVWNWIRRGDLAARGVTLEGVRLWKRRSRKIKRSADLAKWRERHEGHTIHDRPEEVEKLTRAMDLEGDLVKSVKGDGTSILSLISRSTHRQWGEVISRPTQRCVHGALRRLVADMRKEGLRIQTITLDNGPEFENTPMLEAIIDEGGGSAGSAWSGGTPRVYYAEPYRSGQRGRNERNHAIIRRFTGQNLRGLTKARLDEILEFVNDYPRGRYEGRSANEEFRRRLAGLPPPEMATRGNGSGKPGKEERERLELVSRLFDIIALLL